MVRWLTTLVLVLLAAAWAQDSEAQPGHETSLDYAQVEAVEVTVRDGGRHDFAVTVRHRDEGWDHYADAWEVFDPDGEEVYGTRELLHPHDQEQPFTRRLQGVAIPEDVTVVGVRAKCNVHGYGGREVIVDLTRSEGESYVVQEE